MRNFIFVLIFFIAAMAGAETVIYVPKTLDNETANINDVQIEEVTTATTVSKRVLTIPQLEADIAELQAQIDAMTIRVVELQMVLNEVRNAAEQVDLSGT